MNPHVRRYLWSLLAAFILTLIAAALAFYGPKSSDISNVLFLPGMVAALVFFSGGIHSDRAVLYLPFAGTFNVFFYSWVIFGLIVLTAHLRRRKAA